MQAGRLEEFDSALKGKFGKGLTEILGVEK